MNSGEGMGSGRTRFSSCATQRLAVALVLGCASAAAADRPPIAITDVAVVDVEAGRIVAPRTVLVADGRIVAVDAPSNVAVPDDAQHVDGRARFLIPGLVDAHVHLFNNVTHRPPNTWSFPLYVANGVTGVREMAAVPASMPIVSQWRAAIAGGTLVAPRILAAGVVAWGPSPDEAAHQVDLAADAGADFVKVFSELSEPAWRAVLEAAHRRSLRDLIPLCIERRRHASAAHATRSH